METIQRLYDNVLAELEWETLAMNLLRILVLLIVFKIAAILILKVIKQTEKRLVQKGIVEGEPPSESHKRVETIMRLIRQGILVTLWALAALVILMEIGFEVGPVLASAGVIGVALGFGAQNLVRDIISGFFIILENQIRVGDVAIINGTGGLVENIRFRTTVLRDLGGVVHIFPNGTISTLSNLTNDWSAYIFDIGVAYKEDTDRVIEIMKQVGKDLKADETLGPLMLEEPDIFGVDQFADSAVVIKGRIKTLPIRQWQVGREYLRRIKYAFDQNNVEIPFPHTTLYVGEKSKPFDIRMLDQLHQQGSASEKGISG